jgi:hypothetical protein
MDTEKLIEAFEEFEEFGYVLDEDGEPVEIDAPGSPLYGIV